MAIMGCLLSTTTFSGKSLSRFFYIIIMMLPLKRLIISFVNMCGDLVFLL
ncbi:hypothetical protein BVAVS116_E0044 (plasmid) [Borreliella valaisiana VS116]|uniref:Uncharacterized protein n=1 Tax=Borreliella valaisiana VS116 TaxID=445987 RepID=C0R8S5_BORVA|nr:hypothetical protein BVAVS116_E0044 [Borreliella valaisiana VS116]